MQRISPNFRSGEYFVYEIFEETFYPSFIQHCGRRPIETSVTEFCYKSVNLFFEELINIKVILFLIHELFR